MSKSIIQSIKPQYCELIASGKKTIEVRKTRPKLETPFKVYIYCTKGKLALLRDDKDAEEQYKYDYWAFAEFHQSNGMKVLGGKVIGEYVCDYIKVIQALPGRNKYDISADDFKQTHLSQEELWEYGKGKPLYLWHISDLKIYDKSKELSEFMIIDKNKLSHCLYRERIFQNPEITNGNFLYGGYSCSKTKEPDFDDIDFCRGGCADVFKPLTRPPQLWCYVEEAV